MWDGMENRTVSCYLLTSTFLKEGTVLVPDIRLIHLSNRHEDRPDIHSRFSTCYVNSASKLILPIHKLHVELAPSLQVHSPFKKHSSLSRDNSLTQRDLHTAKQSPVPCSSQSSQTLGWIETKFSRNKKGTVQLSPSCSTKSCSCETQRSHTGLKCKGEETEIVNSVQIQPTGNASQNRGCSQRFSREKETCS